MAKTIVTEWTTTTDESFQEPRTERQRRTVIKSRQAGSGLQAGDLLDFAAAIEKADVPNYLAEVKATLRDGRIGQLEVQWDQYIPEES